MRDQGRAAAQEASVDLCIPNVVEIVQRRVSPDDVVNLGVVQRQDHTERADDGACLLAASSRPVQESLINIGLDDREFHARVVAKVRDVCGRTRRGQDLQRDRGIGSHVLGEIDADREIGALFIGRHDLVLGRRDSAPAMKAKRCRHERSYEFPDHVIPSSAVWWACTAQGPRPPRCTSGGEAVPCVRRLLPYSERVSLYTTQWSRPPLCTPPGETAPSARLRYPPRSPGDA